MHSETYNTVDILPPETAREVSGVVLAEKVGKQGKVKATPPANPLSQWAGQYGNIILLANVIRALAPEKIRGDNDDKLTIECPFENEHTTPGGTGTFVMNAGDGHGAGFVVSCQHNHCTGRDRLDFVQKMLDDGWFSMAALRDDKHALELNNGDTRRDIYLDSEGHAEQKKTLRDTMMDANGGTPYLFRFAGNTARLTTNQDGEKRALVMGKEEMREQISRVVRPIKKFREVAVPDDLVNPALLDGWLSFPFLDAVVSTPVFGPAGTLRTENGYDPDSRLYLDLKGLRVPTVPLQPTDDDVTRAKDLLLGNLLVDFPFDGPNNGAAERAHALCLYLQPFVRSMIDGPTPVYLIVKPTPGTGATKLVNNWSLVTAGVPVQASPETTNDEETRKRITSTVKRGANVFYLDNVNRKIDSASLAMAITTDVWTDRELGHSRTIEGKIRWSWIFAGNNVSMSNEMARRCVRIRLDAKVERPELRTEFKHKDLEKWVRANRGPLVWACLTLTQNWIAKGKQPGARSLGTFESWAETMGGILAAAGVNGFLDNDGEMRDAADEEGEAIRAMLAVWWQQFGKTPTPVAGTGGGLYDVFSEHDVMPPIAATNEQKRKRDLGNYVRSLRDRIFTIATDDGGRVSVKIEEGNIRAGSRLWKLSEMGG